MTEQEAFDIALAGLRKQGKPSKNNYSCLYRGPDGTRCAVGFLMPDELYKPEYDVNNSSGGLLAVAEYLKVDYGFLASMQSYMHDGLGDEFLTELELAAEDFAIVHNLTYSEE